MKKVALALMMSLGAISCVEQDDAELTTDEASLKDGDVTVQDTRSQCRADSASLRNGPGGTVILDQVYRGETVLVYRQDGAWLEVHHHRSGKRGWTLAQYYCQ